MQMYKLLVTNPDGLQEIVSVSATGGYYDQSRVLWDERTDGAIPENITLGKMQRVDNQLSELDNFLPEHEAALRSSLIPDVITMRQCRLQLLSEGLLSSVETFVQSQDEATKIYWEYSASVRRNHALVAAVQAHLSKTDDEIDDMFIAAGNLEV